MKTGTLLLVIYLLCVVSWIIYVSVQIAKNEKKDKFELIVFLVTIPFAPVCWIIGATMKIVDAATKNRPKPLSRNLRLYLKKDMVSFRGRTMSIQEVNRITGKNYTLEQVYGKKYVASLNREDRDQFDDGQGTLITDDNVRKDDPAYDSVLSFAEACKDGRMESVRHLFAPDASLVIYKARTVRGIDDVLFYWQDRHERLIKDRIRVDYCVIPCMFYNGIALQESPDGYAPMVVLFRFKEGKIIQMTFSPRFLNAEYQYYGGFREAPFTEEHFRRYFVFQIESMADRIPCPHCGEYSENLEWYTFDHNDHDYFHGYKGLVSVCPHCHRTVEICPEKRYDRTLEDTDSHPNRILEKPVKFSVPRMCCSGVEYSTPLEGTHYLDGVDDRILIEPSDTVKPYLSEEMAMPKTARQCAAEFHHLLFPYMMDGNRECFDQVIDSYRRAYEDGIIEAGNNLAIMYINWAGRAEEGEAIMKDCAEKGCCNAIANRFTILWSMHQDYESATRFALSAPKPTIPVLWNLAVMYLLGPEIKGNTLPVDKEKSKECLRQILDGTAPRFDDICKRYENARALLPRVDDINEFSIKGWDFIGSCIEEIISRKEESHFDVQSTLERHLPHLHVPQGMSIEFSRASEAHDDHGDISRFILLRDNEILSSGDEELLPFLTVEKSAAGAWEAYLFSLSRHLLPTFWHGGYNAREIIFGEEDLRQVPSLAGRSIDVIMNGHELSPSVQFDGGTALVESCYWSEWGGLFRERVAITFDGDRIVDFRELDADNIYNYDCGIMF